MSVSPDNSGAGNIHIHGARLLDPATGKDIGNSNIVVANGVITQVGEAPLPDDANARHINADSLLVIPGLIDCYARLREPGFEKKGTITSETLAARHAGITTLICSPDTDPIIDEPATVELIKRRSLDAGHAQVLPLAAATRGLDGELLSELATLRDAGCIAATNGDRPIRDLQVLRRVMEYAATFNIVLVLSPVDAWLAGQGIAHEGATATRLGLESIPVAAETVALSVLIELAWQTGATIHVSRVTSARGTNMIRRAKADGLRLTADTTINHLWLDDSCLANFDSAYHSVAPFRSSEDREALRAGIADGTLDAICSDHSPHEADAKLAPFPSSEPGLSGLDTLLPLLLQLDKDTSLELNTLIRCVTANPARLFGLDQGTLEAGSSADLVLVDPQATFKVEPARLLSRGRNTAYAGRELCGKVKMSMLGGEVLTPPP